MWSSQFHNMMYSSSKSRTHLIAQHSVHTTTITETEMTRPRLKHLLIFPVLISTVYHLRSLSMMFTIAEVLTYSPTPSRPVMIAGLAGVNTRST